MTKNSNKPKGVSTKDLNGLPSLVLVKETKFTNYSITKKIIAKCEATKSQFLYFHVWLDCLYDLDVDPDSFMTHLSPFLNTAAKKKCLKLSNVFVIACEDTNNSIRPSGSCYIMLNKAIFSYFKGSIDLAILKSKLRMKETELANLRSQLKDKFTLVFTEAYRDMLIQMTIPSLYKACQERGLFLNGRSSLDSPSQSSTKSSKRSATIQPIAPPPGLSKVAPNPPKQPKSQSEPKSRLAYEALPVANKVVHMPVNAATSFTELITKKVPPLTPASMSLFNQVAAPSAGTSRARNGPATNGTVLTNEMIAMKASKLFNEKQVTKTGQWFLKLTAQGNVVISVENLPAVLNAHSLNMMMGTYSINSSRVVAMNLPMGAQSNPNQLMNVRIVLEEGNPDIHRIMSKNKFKTRQNSSLAIKRTDLRELETFLTRNWERIYKLTDDIKLPVNVIGYGNASGDSHNSASSMIAQSA